MVLARLLASCEVGSEIQRVCFTVIVIGVLIKSNHLFKSTVWAFKAYQKAEVFSIVSFIALIERQPEF